MKSYTEIRFEKNISYLRENFSEVRDIGLTAAILTQADAMIDYVAAFETKMSRLEIEITELRKLIARK
jgi:hypothetical protein